MGQHTKERQKIIDDIRLATADPALGHSYIERIGQVTMDALTEAAATVRESGLREEIGALRMVLARLLHEETDLDRLAMNVARIVDSSVRAIRLHVDVLNKDDPTFLHDIQAILDEVEAAKKGKA